MSISRREILLALGTAPLLNGLSAHAAAPLANARIISGFAAGGSADIVCRRVATRLTPNYASSVVVENRTGAAGQIAVSYVKDQPADGATILLTPNSALTIYPHLYKKPPSDLAAVSIGSVFDLAMAVGPIVPVKVRTVPEFLAWAKQNPQAANFGTPGPGTTPHFIGTLLGMNSGVDLRHTPYRGTQPALLDAIGGNLSAVIGPVGDIRQHLGENKMRFLATTGAKRSRFTPEVATLVEQGYKDMSFTQWYAFFLPAKSSKETVDHLNASLRDAVASQDVIDSLNAIAVEARSSTPQELAEAVKQELVTWGPIIQKVGFTPAT